MIRVASYNIRKSVGQDWRRDPDRVLEVLAEIDADIVALQEVDRRFGSSRASSLSPHAIDEQTPYKPVIFGIRPESLGWHGNAILVRKNFEVGRHCRIELPCLEPRGAVLADIAAEGRTLRVVAMHLGLMKHWRQRQARALLDYLESLEEGMPTVMLGDLNEWSTTGGCFEQFAQHHHVVDPGPSFHAKRPFVSLDRIITSPHLQTEASGVHISPKARIASDHLPVWARLRFEPSE
jgi:endonuclease/exonuclease/phosphatase family metal-dependent hydrolase